jgi:hypothetical protein
MIRVHTNGVFGVPAMINRARDSGYWDHPLKTLDDQADLAFVSFFDWDEMNLLDHTYVRVEIAGHPTGELVGKHALIEVHYVAFTAA